MSRITEQVSHLLTKYAAKHFVIAFSGGVDSHVLLHAMKQANQKHQKHKISAIHVNHQLNPLSDHWQQH